MQKLKKGKIKKTNLYESLSEERQEILSRLKQHNWFNNSNDNIKAELFSLPEDFDGYLVDLALRKDEFGNLEILEIEKLGIGYYTVITIFKVRSNLNNEVSTYEYVSGKYGSNPGYRGILFLEVNNKIRYFILKRSEKFAFGGEKTFDSLGGFILYKHGQLANLPIKVEQEIKRQLGLKNIVIKRFIDLGLMSPDSGMVNTRVSLFGATMSIDEPEELKKLDNKTITSTKKISFELLILPIDRLNEYIQKVDDSYFLACIARLANVGVVKI